MNFLKTFLLFGISTLIRAQSFAYTPTASDQKIIEKVSEKLTEMINLKGESFGRNVVSALKTIKEKNKSNERLYHIIEEILKIMPITKNENIENQILGTNKFTRTFSYYPDGSDQKKTIEVNLKDFLDPNNTKVVKYAKKGVYEVYTVDLIRENPKKNTLLTDQASCDEYGGSMCINIITKNGEIIYNNIPSIQEESVGSFYRFTDKGVLFSYIMGEGAPCHGFNGTYFTYFNLDTKKLFYSELLVTESGENDPNSDKCINMTKQEVLHFFDSSKREERKPLDIKAKSTEEAFYQYYNK